MRSVKVALLSAAFVIVGSGWQAVNAQDQKPDVKVRAEMSTVYNAFRELWLLIAALALLRRPPPNRDRG